MDCASINDALREGRVPAGPEVHAHVSDCQVCAALVAWPGGPMAPVEAADGPPDFAGLEAAMADERGIRAWLRELPTSTRLRLVLVTVVATVVAVVLATPRADLAVYPELRLAAELLILGVLIAAVATEALHPMYRPSRLSRVVLSLVFVALAVPFAIAALPLAHSSHALSLAGTGDDFWPRASACFGFGTCVGLPTLALLFFASRAGSMSLRMISMMALAAGITGDLALQLHCPITLPSHLMVGHATVPLALVIVFGVVTRLSALRR